ncbi:MAG: helix-hairpin-helix domain-containing protein [bacterium]
MTRNEFFLACFLVFLILAGIAYRDRVGGGGAIQPVLITRETEDTSVDSAPYEIPPITATVNINRAVVEDLASIPGVDSECAENIVAFRNRYGPFSDLRELMEVPGIGRSRYEEIRAYVRLADFEFIQVPTPVSIESRTVRSENRGSGPIIGDGGKRAIRLSPVPKPTARVSRTRPRAQTGPRNLNQATLADLKAVSGVGDVLAQRIIQARDQRKGFKSWNEVRGIEGIGEIRLQALQKHFVLPER